MNKQILIAGLLVSVMLFFPINSAYNNIGIQIENKSIIKTEYHDIWDVQTVDSIGDVGWYTSIALDSNDNPHISYQDLTFHDLKYAFWNGSDWNIQTVDSVGYNGWYTSIALDSNDNPHISYHSATNNDLKYAFWNGSNWNIQIVDSAGQTGWYTSIALDSNDNPHISYHFVTNKDLKYAFWNGSNWNIQTVDSLDDVGSHTSIALDSNDNPHISYSSKTNGSKLKYTFWNGIAWDIQTITSTGYFSGPHISIALDTNDRPHISYYGGDSGGLMYCYLTGIYWNIQSIDPPFDCGFASSIALDTNNFPHISYFYSWEDSDLKYAKKIAENQPPNAPIIIGPKNGKVGEEHCWNISSVDPDGDNLMYIVDWGDGDTTETECYPSGMEVEVCHTYTDQGTYTIKVKAKECPDGLIGAEATLTITITKKSKAIQNPVQYFLQSHPNLFPILRQILGLQ